MSTIAERLGKLIDDKGFTPYQVARDTGVSDATLSRLLSGKTQKMSGNTAPEYQDFFLSLNDVVQLFYIKELMRRNAL